MFRQDSRRAARACINQAGLALVVMLAFASVIRAQAQGAEIGPDLQRHRYELRLAEGRLDGPAARWLREEASKVQFLFVGEEHDTREIPLILAALWPELVPLGYRHVAIEAGQWLGGRLDRYARFQGRRALARFKAAAFPRRPNVSVPPSSEEDLEFYARLGSAGQFDAPVIWGLDHEFKATPLLKRLGELAPDSSRRQRVASLLARVEAAERVGKYNLQPFKSEINALIRAFRFRPGTEGEQLLDALRRRVFGEEYDQERGDVFRQLFLRNYRAAQRAGEARPRVLLRFGSYHAGRGLMPEFGTSTLANFVAEFAFTEGARMLNVMFIACAPDSPSKLTDDWRARQSHPRHCSPRERAWLKPFSEAAGGEWTLFDVRALRERARRGELAVGWELREVITGFDAVILLKESAPARFAR
jgi:hypothetical protein